MLNLLANISVDAHQICLASSPQESPWLAIYQALVCGAPLEGDSLRSLFVRLGLIHLMVVSGAHFVFLESYLLRWFRNPSPRHRIGLIGVLGIYTFVALLRPPVVRAWLQSFLNLTQNHLRWHWTRPQLLLVTGIMGLILNPSWLGSLSYQLSWCASLALNKPTSHKGSSFRQALKVYIFLLPLLLPLQAPHPLSIFINGVFSPLFAMVLLPSTWLGFWIPPLTPISDGIWNIFLTINENWLTLLPLSNSYTLFNTWQSWLYILGLHSFLLKMNPKGGR